MPPSVAGPVPPAAEFVGVSLRVGLLVATALVVLAVLLFGVEVATGSFTGVAVFSAGAAAGWGSELTGIGSALLDRLAPPGVAVAFGATTFTGVAGAPSAGTGVAVGSGVRYSTVGVRYSTIGVLGVDVGTGVWVLVGVAVARTGVAVAGTDVTVGVGGATVAVGLGGTNVAVGTGGV